MKAKAIITFAISGALPFLFSSGAYPQAATESGAITSGVSAAGQAVHPPQQLPGPGQAPGAPAAPPASEPNAAPLPPSPSTFHDSTNDLYLTVGKTVLVDCQYPVTRVATGLGDVAVANVVSSTEIMVDGRAAGQTSLIIWDNRGGRQFFNVTVRPNDSSTQDTLALVRRELRENLPGQALNVSLVNGSIFLRGTVKDLNSSTRAVQIASTAGKVVNLLDVTVPAPKPQILLKVRFASLDLTRSRDLGINLFNLGNGGTINNVTTGQFSPPVVQSGGFGGNQVGVQFSNELNLLTYFPGLKLGATVQALENRGILQVLDEPNLVTEDGKQASFLAGGQFPYPVVQGGGAGSPATVTIQFKDYGVSLAFIPTIMPNNNIRLQVAPEVSALDYANEVQISGFLVPGLTTRAVNTEVDLADGESFLIGGLLDRSITNTFNKIPFIGDVPILGKFFQSESRTKNNTELIVIVTPEIISPIPAGTAPPELNYPLQFMPQSSKTVNNPENKTAANTLPAAPATIPVEKLIESLKPETPLAGISTQSVGGNLQGGASGSSSTPTQ
ncbi:MAG TPA: pilus assembly protein N-terminal domain-containing protein [Terracidiphilus sp.]|nr:pilus assembly protein N-terminal domain-containing protein [Terracidiphilus sp.]